MRNSTQILGKVRRLWFASGTLAIALGLIGAPTIHAQLAITEVMSDAATNCTGMLTSHPDIWELYNYGAYSIDLNDYRLWDIEARDWDDRNVLTNITIAPGEAIIFVRDNASIPDEEAFRAWWGEHNLPANLQVHFYGNHPGFDGEGGDGVRLWDAQTNLVDEVVFPQAVLNQGITFVNDLTTGEFGVLSQEGVNGAFKAETCDDIGSPGFVPTNTVPMAIVRQPESKTVDAGSPVTLQVQARGLPRPRGYNWYHNHIPITNTPTATGDEAIEDIPIVINYAGCGLAWKTKPPPEHLVIPNVQLDNAGQYYAVLTNGLECLTSSIVTLTVNTNPTPPQIECSPDVWWFPPLAGQRQTNLIVTRFQPAIFDVKYRGYPQPTFRWEWSGDGTTFYDLFETNHSLVFTRVSPDDAGIYRVYVENPEGTNFADAYLTVEIKPARPYLRITEAMAYACHGAARDWWELTNTGDKRINLTGYRWNDKPGNLGGGPTITNAIVIQPGESIILLESQSRGSFVEWWGEENLPPNLQCIVYRGSGLSEESGDWIRLWNQSAIGDGDLIDSLSFSSPVEGASYWFDRYDCLYSRYGVTSQSGDCGGFLAANGCDVGSPGWTRWTPPHLTAVRREGSTAVLEWKAQPGSTNRLEFTRALANPPEASVWTSLGEFGFPGVTGNAIDTNFNIDSHRFYRLRNITNAHCNCPEL